MAELGSYNDLFWVPSEAREGFNPPERSIIQAKLHPIGEDGGRGEDDGQASELCPGYRV